MSSNAALKLGRMLKNVRHISEGHYYGLHVTNKAKNVSLDKKLKTLEACRDAQNHCYRKEEKDLVNTLARLRKSKDQYHHNDDLILRHFGERPWMKGDREYHDLKQLAHKLKNQGSSASLELPPAPSPSAHDVGKIPDQKHYTTQPISSEVGSAIHRTVGFTDCVICRLPKSSHVNGTDICRCEKGPDKGTHHMHPAAIHEDKARVEYLHTKERRELYEKTHPHEHEEKQVGKIDSKHERLSHGENADGKEGAQDFLAKLHREMQMVIETPSQPLKDSGYDKPMHIPVRKGSFGNGKQHTSYGYDKSPHSPPGRKGSFGHNQYKESSGHEGRRGSITQDRPGYRLRINSLLDDERYRNRVDSIIEDGPYIFPKGQRKMTMDVEGLRKRMDSIGRDSYYSVGELRSRTSTAADPADMMHKTINITHSAMYPSSPPHDKHRPHTLGSTGFSVHGETHLPKLLPHHEGSNEAFHGLIHPDNVINHHHYLPYEADKHHKKTHHGEHQHGSHHHGKNHHGSHHGIHHHGNHHYGDRHHDDHHHHDKRHFHGYYIHKYDHAGTRQIAHIPIGANTHIAEMLEKQREPDSHHLTLLSNLRHLLSVYQRLDDSSPRYPWPASTPTEMTKEEFEKLKDCRCGK